MRVRSAKDAIGWVDCIFSQFHYCNREIPKQLFLCLDLFFLLVSTPFVLCQVFVMRGYDLAAISTRVMLLFAANISHLLSINYIFTHLALKVEDRR